MRRNKILPILVATLLLGLGMVVGLLVPQMETHTLTFKAGDGQGARSFTTYHDDSTRCHYLFLPGYVELGSVTLETQRTQLAIGGTTLRRGKNKREKLSYRIVGLFATTGLLVLGHNLADIRNNKREEGA